MDSDRMPPHYVSACGCIEWAQAVTADDSLRLPAAAQRKGGFEGRRRASSADRRKHGKGLLAAGNKTMRLMSAAAGPERIWPASAACCEAHEKAEETLWYLAADCHSAAASCPLPD